MVRVTRKACKMSVATLILMALCLLIHPKGVLFAAGFTGKTLEQHTTAKRAQYTPLAKFRLQGIDGPYSTQGNQILGADHQPYLFHGVARDDLEYLCTSDGHYTDQELAYMGTGTSTANATYWGANIVRFPLSENFWLYGASSQGCSATQYRALIQRIVATLTKMKLNVLLDLQWTNAGGHSLSVGDQAGDAWSMPDKDSITFWQQVATAYKGSANILFELFNEPHGAGDNWTCWRNGCQITNDNSGPGGHDRNHFSYQAIGMQTLVNTIRQAGANNLAIVAGVNWGFNLSQIPTYHLDGSNIVYDTHPYPYTGKTASYWDAAFGTTSATYPVISSESGEYDCHDTFVSQLIDYFDIHGIGWIAWAWVPPVGSVCTYPSLITRLNGTPAPRMGQYIYQYLHLYLGILAGQEIPAKLQ